MDNAIKFPEEVKGQQDEIIQLGCRCKKSVLCVDDTYFNLIPLTKMIEKQFSIISD
jgi:hypothetical protein